MKIIDLLVKISKDEEVPKCFKVNNHTWKWNVNSYQNELYGEFAVTGLRYDLSNLNDEVEIIEEDKPVITKEELENRIENALEFLETQYNTFPSGEMWREALKNTLQGKDYDDVYAEDKKIEPIKYEVNKVIGLDTCIDKINEIIDKINGD